MVKHCSWGQCNVDTRYPEKWPGVTFVPFPKPKTKLDACRRWIKACARPHKDLNIKNIDRHKYVCSLHFVNGRGPTETHPDPIPADGSKVTKGRRVLKKSLPEPCCSPEVTQAVGSSSDADKTTQTEEGPEEMALRRRIKELEAQNATLLMGAEKRQEHSSLKDRPFNFEKLKKMDEKTKGRFVYYTGFTCIVFMTIFQFLIPDMATPEIEYVVKRNDIITLPLIDQLLLTLCRLRNNFDVTDLACRFGICHQAASELFTAWVNFMFDKFGKICIWPDRSVIMENMPREYATNFPNTLAIIDGTELKCQSPSSLVLQSQCYSDYKSHCTLKALVVVDPRGSVLFSSPLFTGSISDKDICYQSGFMDLLRKLISEGKIQVGDGIMADKGFNMEKDFNELGLRLNIPPFASSTQQMSHSDVEETKKIARHRIHVERSIRRIKCFKILANRVKTSQFYNFDQIWFVCCFLTNFQTTLVRK